MGIGIMWEGMGMLAMGKGGMGMKCCHGNRNGNDFMGIGGIGNSKIIPTHL